MALGDSLAAGYQPGGAELRDTAYPALTATRLEAAGGDLTLENLGCSGETTTSLLKGGKCDFAAGSQLEQAEKLLKGSSDVSLVTVDIGGNDLLRCVRGGAQIDTTCVTAGVGTVKKNLPTILKRLKAAAGPDVPVLVLGYYNPWLAAKALDQPIKGVDAAAKAYTGLSTAIESAAKRVGHHLRRSRRGVLDQRHDADHDQRPVGAEERRADLHAHQHLHRLRHPPHRRGCGHRGPGSREGRPEGRRLLTHGHHPVAAALGWNPCASRGSRRVTTRPTVWSTAAARRSPRSRGTRSTCGSS